ncbi:MAG: HNH endonuclease signature motif containing protein [Candidatus Dormibacteria bacterium]
MVGGLGGDLYVVPAACPVPLVREAGTTYGPRGGPPAMFPELRDLKAAVRRVVFREEVDYRPDQLVKQMAELVRQSDILRREAAQIAGTLERTNEAERQAFHTTTDLVRHTCNLSVRAASELVVVGKQLDQLPMSSVALDEGAIGFGHLANLARTAAFIETHKKGHFDEVPLLARAEQESVSRFSFTCNDARHAQDPEAVTAAEVDAVEQRELKFNAMDDGITYLNARLDSVGAGVVRTLLEGMAVKCGTDDQRRLPRRMADALIDLATERMARGDLADHGGAPVAISIVCTDRHFQGEPGSPGASMEYCPVSISSVATQRYACNATITAMWLDGRLVEGEVDFTHPKPTKRQRRAIAARDGGCRYPGCHKSPSQCEVHHVVFRSHGGKTTLSNMIMLCSFHHWKAHEGGWKVGLRDDGQVFVIPPTPALARGPGAFGSN